MKHTNGTNRRRLIFHWRFIREEIQLARRRVASRRHRRFRCHASITAVDIESVKTFHPNRDSSRLENRANVIGKHQIDAILFPCEENLRRNKNPIRACTAFNFSEPFNKRKATRRGKFARRNRGRRHASSAELSKNRNFPTVIASSHRQRSHVRQSSFAR